MERRYNKKPDRKKNQNQDMEVKTFFPTLFRPANNKERKYNGNGPYITVDSANTHLSEYGNNGCPSYLETTKEILESITSFPNDFFESTYKLQDERSKKIKEKEIEAMKERKKQDEAELKISGFLDREVTTFLKMRRFYYKRICPVQIPYKSTLTHEEHEAFIRTFIKFKLRPGFPKTGMERLEVQRYQVLLDKVVHEQGCLMNFANNALQLQLADLNTVPEPIEKYIQLHYQHRALRTKNYSAVYTQEMEIPLKPFIEFKCDIVFNHVGNLLSQGSVPQFHIPAPSKRYDLPIDDELLKNKPPNCDQKFSTEKYLYKTPVSKDPNAKFLAEKHGAHIVMSASAFNTLVTNHHPYDKDWAMPVTINTHNYTENGKSTSMRVAYIDKPFVKKWWLAHQKKQTFFKKCTQALFTEKSMDPHFTIQNFAKREFVSCDDVEDEFGVFSSPIKKKKRNLSFDSDEEPDYSPLQIDTSEDLNSISLDESPNRTKVYSPKSPEYPPREKTSLPSSVISPSYHPVYSPKSPTSPPENNDSNNSTAAPASPPYKPANDKQPIVNNNKKSPNKLKQVPNNKQKKASRPVESTSTKEREEPNDDSFIGGILSSQSSLLKPSKDLPKAQCFVYSEPARRKVAQVPWSNTIKTSWDNFKPKECPPWSRMNVHYQLFTMEYPHTGDKLKILVRHNLHGMTKFFNPATNRYSSEAFVLYPKLENQAYFGAECHSIHEISEQWAMLVTRPNTTLYHMRICAATGTLIMGSKVRLEEVVKEAIEKHVSFQPQTALQSLFVAFQNVLRMQSGDYVMYHSPNTNAFIKLMKMSNIPPQSGRSSLSLHKVYDSAHVSRQYGTAPFLPIDTHILTPFHLFHRKIPATFPMENVGILTKKRKMFIKNRAKQKKSLSLPVDN